MQEKLVNYAPKHYKGSFFWNFYQKWDQLSVPNMSYAVTRDTQKQMF